MFQWVECTFVIFAVFIKTAPFSRVRGFFWYRAVFFVVLRWPESSFWYRDLLFLVSRLMQNRLLPGINPCVLFWGLDILYIGGQKGSRHRKNDRKISIPPKRHLDTKSPLLAGDKNVKTRLTKNTVCASPNKHWSLELL